MTATSLLFADVGRRHLVPSARAAALSFMLGGCAATPAVEPWSYAGAGGPDRWAALSPEFAACAGSQQSPVALEAAAAVPAEPPALRIDWTPFAPRIEAEGPTVAAFADGRGGGAALGNTRFELLQYHFHAPSEHVVDGVRAPMEVHFVHRAADGRLLVVGALIVEGAPNPALAALWAQAEGEEEPAAIDAAALTPADRSLYAYEGSLTTPPCSEIVSWRVMARPVSASAEQIATFARGRDANARPLQALARRFVLRTP